MGHLLTKFNIRLLLLCILTLLGIRGHMAAHSFKNVQYHTNNILLNRNYTSLFGSAFQFQVSITIFGTSLVRNILLLLLLSLCGVGSRSSCLRVCVQCDSGCDHRKCRSLTTGNSVDCLLWIDTIYWLGLCYANILLLVVLGQLLIGCYYVGSVRIEWLQDQLLAATEYTNLAELQGSVSFYPSSSLYPKWTSSVASANLRGWSIFEPNYYGKK